MLPGCIDRGVGCGQDIEELVLDPKQDSFFKDNMHLNFGEIGELLCPD